MVQVVNRHKFSGNGVYIGRPSVLGNPFKLKSANGQYELHQSIECYRVWLREQWRMGGEAKKMLLRLVAQVNRGEELTLICSCAPKACHGDVVKDVIETLIAKGF